MMSGRIGFIGDRAKRFVNPDGLGGEMPHLGDDEGILARAGIFARNQERICSPASHEVLVFLFSLHRALGCARE